MNRLVGVIAVAAIAVGPTVAHGRYYDPGIGRFLSQDKYAGQSTDIRSPNRYAYVRGNPLRYVDPSGNIELGDEYGYTRSDAVKAMGEAFGVEYALYRYSVQLGHAGAHRAGGTIGDFTEYATRSSVAGAWAASTWEFAIGMPVGLYGLGTVPEFLVNSPESVNQSLIAYQASDERGDTAGKWKAGSQILGTGSGVVLSVAGTTSIFRIGRGTPRTGVVVESSPATEVPVPERSVAAGRAPNAQAPRQGVAPKTAAERYYEEQQARAASAGENGGFEGADLAGIARPGTLKDPLPPNPKKPTQANPHAPDPDAVGPHTVVGTRTDPKQSPAPYLQGITYDASGQPLGRTDVTTHGRGDHPNPHWHPYDPKIPNPFDQSRPGNFGPAEPVPR